MVEDGEGDGDLDLDVRQNDSFQRREWRVEAVGTALLAIFLVAGILGFLGPGPFSQTTATSQAGTLEVEYQRVAHYKSSREMTLTVSEEAVEDGTATVELTGPWVGGADISDISPQPTEQYATDDGMTLEFAVSQPGDVEIGLSVRPTEYGPLAGRAAAGASEGDSVSFSQFVLP